MIKVFTFNGTTPELLELQVASFRKYLQEDFEFVVFNSEILDEHPEKSKEVSKIGQSLGIRVIEAQVDADIEAATARAITVSRIFSKDGKYLTNDYAFLYAIEWAWKRIISKEKGPICMIHSDVFLTEPIKLTDYLQEQMMRFILQYPSEARFMDKLQMGSEMFLADVSKLPNPETMCWLGGAIDGCPSDVSGQTYYYLKAHPEIKYLPISLAYNNGDDANTDFHPARYQILELDGKKILHYMSGSRQVTDRPYAWNWAKEKADEYHIKKLAWARRVIGIPDSKNRVTIFQAVNPS